VQFGNLVEDVTGDPPSILAFPKFMLMRYVGLSGVNHLNGESTGTVARDDMREAARIKLGCEHESRLVCVIHGVTCILHMTPPR
jgi:hypothetical protein